MPDPIQEDGHSETPRIKLTMGVKDPEPAAQIITLKMRGQTSETPSREATQAGVTVDNESLRRQQDLVRAGSGSQEVDASRSSPRSRSLRRLVGSPKSSAATTPSASEQLHNIPSHGREAMGMIKDENAMASAQAERRPSHDSHWLHQDSSAGAHPLGSESQLAVVASNLC